MREATPGFLYATYKKVAGLSLGMWCRVRTNPFPPVAALLVAAIFVERLVVHEIVYSVPNAAAQTANVFCCLVTYLFVLLSLVLDRETLGKAKVTVRSFRNVIFRRVLSPMPVFVCLLFALIALSRGAMIQEDLRTTFRFWMEQTLRVVYGLWAPFAVATLVGTAYLICLVIYRLVRVRTEAVQEAIQELIISAYFVLANASIYLLIGSALIIRAAPRGVWGEAAGGLIKDTLLYSLAVLGIVAGTYKAGQVLRHLRAPVYRWVVLAMMAMGAIACIVPAATLELSYKDNVLRMGRALEYPNEWQQDIIAFHIGLRIFLFSVLTVAAFLRLFAEIERVNLEDASKLVLPATAASE